MVKDREKRPWRKDCEKGRKVKICKVRGHRRKSCARLCPCVSGVGTGAVYLLLSIPSDSFLIEEEYSEGVIPVVFLNCREK